MPKISMILPVYNAKRTLGRCLDSVLSQSYADFEIVCCNDGSTDGSLDVLKAYQAKDARVRVLDQKNGGVSRARNEALANATGEYLAFIDADDYMEPDALQSLVGLAMETGANLLASQFLHEDEQGNALSDSPVFSAAQEIEQFTAEQAVGAMLAGKPFTGHLHGKLIRRACMLGCEFDPGIAIYEDMLLLLRLCRSVKRVAYIPKPTYHYVDNEQGACNSPLSAKKATSADACEAMLSLCRRCYPDSAAKMEGFAIQDAMQLLGGYASLPMEQKREKWAQEAVEKARQRLLHPTKEGLQAARLTKAQKILRGSLRLGIPAFTLCYAGPYRLLKRLAS